MLLTLSDSTHFSQLISTTKKTKLRSTMSTIFTCTLTEELCCNVTLRNVPLWCISVCKKYVQCSCEGEYFNNSCNNYTLLCFTNISTSYYFVFSFLILVATIVILSLNTPSAVIVRSILGVPVRGASFIIRSSFTTNCEVLHDLKTKQEG